MSYTPIAIRRRRFSIRARGYQKKAVEAFLARAAADLELAMAAVAQDPDSGLVEGIFDIEEAARAPHRDAYEEARNARRQALEEVARIRERGAEDARAIREEAARAATALIADAELVSERARAAARELSARTCREVEQMRLEAIRDAESVRATARDRAFGLLTDAERVAQALIERTRSESESLLEETITRMAAFETYERELAARIRAIESLQETLTESLDRPVSEAVVLDHSGSEGDRNRSSFVEPREAQLAAVARLLNAPAQEAVSVLAAPLRDLATMLDKVLARKKAVSRRRPDPADRW